MPDPLRTNYVILTPVFCFVSSAGCLFNVSKYTVWKIHLEKCYLKHNVKIKLRAHFFLLSCTTSCSLYREAESLLLDLIAKTKILEPQTALPSL